MKQLLLKLKRQPKHKEVVDELLVDEEELRKSMFDSAIKKTLAEEKFRFRTNFKIATTTTYISLFLVLPFGLISWLMNLFGFVEISPINILPWWIVMIIWLMPYMSWHYTTITIPQKEGPVIKKDWSKTAKGRKRAALYNLIPFHVMSWASFSKYVYHEYFDYLTTLNVTGLHKDILVTDNLNSLLLILFVTPVIISGFAVFTQVRDYMINKDLLQGHFMEWQMPIGKKYAHEYKLESVDVIVGYDMYTKKPIVIKENERFLHEAIIGATGSGKTSTTLLLRIAQDLIKIATGVKEMGLVLLEPKGDAVDDVLTICKKLGIPDEKIVVIDPFKEMSYKYNPFIGERNIVANTFQGTISALTGDQDQFFKDQQNEMCKQITLIAKMRYGNRTNIRIIQQLIDDPRELANVVEHVSAFVEQNRRNPNATPLQLKELDAYEVVVNYFVNQVLDYKTFRDKDEIKEVPYPPNHRHHPAQMVENKKENYISGAKKYLNDLVNEDSLRALFTSGENDRVFDADKFLSEGGVVLVNTALGELDELSMMFGQFFIRQFQSSVFRRAKENKEENVKRIPCIFYVDEFPLYANEAFERFLTLGRSYKVGAVIAMQSIAQLDAVGTDYRKTVMANASHKTVFGRGPVDDNEYFSKEFGEEIRVEESVNETGAPMTTDNQSWSFRMNSQKKLMPRFTPTDIRELPFKQMIVQIVDESNSIAPPKHAVGEFVHESAFVQRFMKLVEADIKSTVEREVNVVAAINSSRSYAGQSSGGMIEDHENQQALSNPTEDETQALENSAVSNAAEEQFEMEPVKVMANPQSQQPQPQMKQVPNETIEPAGNAQESIDDVFGYVEEDTLSMDSFASPTPVISNDVVLVNEPASNTVTNNEIEQPSEPELNELASEPSYYAHPISESVVVNNSSAAVDDWSVLLAEEEDPVDEIEIPSNKAAISSQQEPTYEETSLDVAVEPVSLQHEPIFEETNLDVGIEPATAFEPVSSQHEPMFEETSLDVGIEPIAAFEPVSSQQEPIYEETNLDLGNEGEIRGTFSGFEQPTILDTDDSNRLSAVQDDAIGNSNSNIPDYNASFQEPAAHNGYNLELNSESIVPIPDGFETSIIDTQSNAMIEQLQKELVAANDVAKKESDRTGQLSENGKKKPIEEDIIELEI